MFWVVCYDIVDDRRRARVHKLLEGYGRRVQYSVFECDLNAKRLDQLEGRLARLIHAEEDDVRLYPLDEGEVGRIRLLGRARINRPLPAHII